MNIIKEIGMPAVLEQLGEECCELGQAALKLARKYRDENPTPKTESECLDNLAEEIADVMLCIDLLVEDLDMGEIITHGSIESIQLMKYLRWSGRIAEWKMHKKEQDKNIMAVYMKGE